MLKIASVVLLFFLNPNYDSFITWLVSTQYDILSLSIAVKILLITGSIVIPLYLLGIFLSPFLWIGFNRPTLQESGELTWLSSELKSFVVKLINPLKFVSA